MTNQRGFALAPFMFDPRVWAALIVAGAALGAWMYVRHLQATVEELTAWQQAFMAESKRNEAEVAKMQAANDNHAREVAHGYAEAIRTITGQHGAVVSRLRGMLYSPAAGCAATRLPDATPGTDARPADAGLGAGGLEAAAVKLEQDCAATTTQLLYLQNWVRGVK